MSIDIGTKTVHGINSVSGLELPGSSLERVWKIVESTNGAQVDNISGELIGDHRLDISGDLVDLSTTNLSESELTSDLLGESNTSRAMNASSHGGLDEGTDILVLDGTFVFSESAFFVSVNSRNILKVAFSALIANGAIKRMISEEEFHNTTSSDSSLLGLGDNLHIRSNLSSAGGNRLGDTLDLN